MLVLVDVENIFNISSSSVVSLCLPSNSPGQVFNHNLLALRLDASPGTVAALDRLHELEPDFVSELKQAFESAKQRVSLRFRQATSYLLEFPWNLCKILSYFCKPISQPVDDQRFVNSKSWAKKLVDEYDTGLLRGAAEFARFLDASEPLGASMRYWAMSDDIEMRSDLLCELLAYGSSLTSMQRLESKHHLVSQRMGIARNSTPSTLSANLRRTLNGDVNSHNFKNNFGRYLMEFAKLVDTPWQSRTELARLISGYHLDVMFADLSKNQQLILSQYVPKHTSKHTLDLINHLKTVLEEGLYYAIPSEVGPDRTTTYSIVQLITFTPSSKKYMRKVLKWSTDPWFEKVGVVMVGNTVVQPTEVCIDCDSSICPCPLPVDFSYTTSSTYPTEISVDNFFKTDFEFVYSLEHVDYETVFSTSALNNIDNDDVGNMSLMYFGGETLTKYHIYIWGFLDVFRFKHRCANIWPVTFNLLRQNVNKIGASAAASSTTPMPIPRTLMAAARWLEGVDLASFNEKGELILLDDA